MWKLGWLEMASCPKAMPFAHRDFLNHSLLSQEEHLDRLSKIVMSFLFTHKLDLGCLGTPKVSRAFSVVSSNYGERIRTGFLDCLALAYSLSQHQIDGGNFVCSSKF